MNEIYGKRLILASGLVLLLPEREEDPGGSGLIVGTEGQDTAFRTGRVLEVGPRKADDPTPDLKAGDLVSYRSYGPNDRITVGGVPCDLVGREQVQVLWGGESA